jgi:hypothetical protein
MRANSAGVQSVRPALLCSFVDSLVSVLLTMALPASSGCADQRELPVRTGVAHDVRHRLLQVAERAERPLRQRLLRDPGRVLVQAVQQAAASSAAAALSCSMVRGMSALLVKGGLLPVARDVDAAADPHASCCAMWSRKRCSA